jgi:cytoplasmic iron level regulating protein YaaA (DUF328/UPF0246 family)
MIAVLSPAKTLDYASALPPLEPTLPRFGEEAETLARAAAKLGPRKLAKLMHISEKLSVLNADRFSNFADAEDRPALYAFDGDVYAGFEVRTLDPVAVDFAQVHLRLLSGLYGLLRPLDVIKPYRLEMGTRWAPGRPADLYGFWKNRVADALTEDLAAAEGDVVLNLASNEYWRAVEDRLPRQIRVVSIDFREPGPDGPRFVSFNAKRARGMMARWMCEHRVTDVEGMKGFDSDGYRYDAAESTADRWRFARA